MRACLTPQLRSLWWWVRGVTPETSRAVCARCGHTGQVHMLGCGCRRFRSAERRPQ
jgi:hypothetical protein